MIEILEKLQKSRATKLDFPCLFDDTNIQSIYGMLDPTGRGFITLQQYMEGITIKTISKQHVKSYMYRINCTLADPNIYTKIQYFFYEYKCNSFFTPLIFLNICIHIRFLNVNELK